ncbi:MAG: hypothetical protein ACLT2T_04300 [Bilophila wadsworthia]
MKRPHGLEACGDRQLLRYRRRNPEMPQGMQGLEPWRPMMLKYCPPPRILFKADIAK